MCENAYDKHMVQVRRGFTIIEIVIIIALMGILLVMVAAQFRSSQASARDDALRADAEIIARGLEDYYRTGYRGYSSTQKAGSYPSGDELRHASGENVIAVGPQVSGGYLNGWLNGARIASTSKLRLITTSGQSPENTTNISASTPVGIVTYEPLIYNPAGTGSYNFCTTVTQRCTRFNLYYRSEVDNTIHTIRSEHQ